MYSPEIQARIAELRVKAAQGTLTPAEMREAIDHLREGRALAQTASKAKRTAAAKPDGEGLLDQLRGL